MTVVHVKHQKKNELELYLIAPYLIASGQKSSYLTAGCSLDQRFEHEVLFELCPTVVLELCCLCTLNWPLVFWPAVWV